MQARLGVTDDRERTWPKARGEFHNRTVDRLGEPHHRFRTWHQYRRWHVAPASFRLEKFGNTVGRKSVSRDAVHGVRGNDQETVVADHSSTFLQNEVPHLFIGKIKCARHDHPLLNVQNIRV